MSPSRRMNTKKSCLSFTPRIEDLESRRLLAATDAKLFEYLAENSETHAIIGGSASERGTREWVVSVQDRFGHFCGGTLVAQDAVVTAAHCVEGSFASNLFAVVGREDLTRTDDGERVSVSEIIVHPDYNARTNDSDIAVLRLSDPVTSQPIGYLTPETASLAAAGIQATTLGWGTTREGGSPVTDLREVTVPIVSNATANLPISYGGDVTGRMLAAGLSQGGVDSCQGDSGGPLVTVDSQGEPRLAGVVSWGEGCGRPNKFGVYARVTEFADWLDGIIGIDSAGQLDFAQERYLAGDSASIVLRDQNVIGEEVQVTVSSAAGDQETITLESFSPGRFRGEIPIVNQAVNESDGTLDIAGEEQITVTYLDVDDGDGNSITRSATALVIEDDFGNSADDAALLTTTGGQASIEGEIEVAGDVDWFRFEVTEGRGYFVSQELTGSLNDSTLTIYAEDGVSVLGFDDDGGRGLASELTFFPSESGTVFFEASGFGANVGTYTLIVQETDSSGDDHSDIVGGATAITLEQLSSGNINTAGDADWFTFETTAGRNYQFNVLHRSLGDAQLRLVDADGRTEIAFNDDRNFRSTEPQLFLRASETRRVFVEVTGFDIATGSYDLLVSELADDHGQLPAEATDLGSVTAEVVSTGELTPVDADWFAFTAEQDTFYGFETSLTSLPDSVLRIYDTDGQQVLAQNDDFIRGSLASRIVWQAPADGQFFVEVSGFDQANGAYGLSIERLAQTEDDLGNRAELASPLEIGQDVPGNVDFQSDRDWLRFDTVAGHAYTFEVELRTLNDSFLEIYGADGATLLAENDDVEFPDVSSRIEWTAPSTGVSYVVVSAFDGFLGSYELVSSEVAPEFPLGDLDRDGVTNDEDIDAFYAELGDGTPDDELDFNDDGEVNSDDAVTLVVDYLGTNFGDVDLNRTVDFGDFLILSQNFGQAGGWGEGDFDGDGTIGFADFLLLSQNFGA